MRHPIADLDEVVHQRARLGILAILAEASEVDFGYLRQTLKPTDGKWSTSSQRPRHERAAASPAGRP